MEKGVVGSSTSEKPKRQNNSESCSPGHDNKSLVATTLLDIESVDDKSDSFNNSSAHVGRHNTSEASGVVASTSCPNKLPQSPDREKIWVKPTFFTNPVSDLEENTNGHKQVIKVVTGKPPFCGGRREPLHNTQQKPLKQGGDTQPTKSKETFAPKESPNDDLESSFPNEEGLMMAVKEEIPQPSKQTSVSPSTTQEKEDLEMRVPSLNEKNKELSIHLHLLRQELIVLEEQLKCSQERVNSLEKEVTELHLNQTYLVKCQRHDSESENLKELQMRTKISDLEEEIKQLRELVDQKQRSLDGIIGYSRECQSEDFESENLEELQMRTKISDLEEEIKQLKELVDQKQTLLDCMIGYICEPSPSVPLSVATPMNVSLYDCIKCDDTDFKMMKVAVAGATHSQILQETDHLPSVCCVIRGFTLNRLPVYSIGWNGFIANTDKKDLDAVKSRFERSKKRDRVLAKHYCLHAEVQALNSYPGNLLDATAYVTHPPCHDCAKQLIQRGIRRVFYLFWLNGCESTIELFEQQDITCMAFPQRDLILRDFRLGFLKTTGINRGGTDTDKLPEKCPSFVGSKDRAANRNK